MPTSERPPSEPLYTYDARPVVQVAGNRPPEEDAVIAEAAAGAVTRWKRLQAHEAPVDPRAETLGQVATIFGYAMLGAALFQAGWVLLSHV